MQPLRNAARKGWVCKKISGNWPSQLIILFYFIKKTSDASARLFKISASEFWSSP